MDEEPTKPTGTEVAKPQIYASGRGAVPIMPTTLDDIWRIATAVVRSGLAPYGIDSAEKASVIIMHGLEVGLAPMVALQSIAVINGKPSLYGDGALGVVRASGQLEKFSEKINAVGTNIVASCTVKRRGEAALTRTFSKDEAILAKLWDKKTYKGEPTPWVTYPNRMLQMRARAFALRDGFADVMRGLGIREEMEDVDPTIDLIAPPPPPPPPPKPTPLEAAIAKSKEVNREIKTDEQGLVIWDETTERPAQPGEATGG